MEEQSWPLFLSQLLEKEEREHCPAVRNIFFLPERANI